MSNWNSIDNVLTIEGSLNLINQLVYPAESVVFADSPFDATSAPYLISVDTTGGNVIINLPPVGAKRIAYLIKKVDATANTVTINANGSDTIEGSANDTLTTAYDYLHIVSNGTVWLKVS